MGKKRGLPYACFYFQIRAALHLRYRGGIWLITDSHSVGVDISVPLIILMIPVNCPTTFWMWTLLIQIGAPYSAIKLTTASAKDIIILGVELKEVPHSL